MKPIKVIFAMLIVVVCAAFFIATPRNAQAAPLMASWFFEDDMESGLSPWSCWEGPGTNCYSVDTSSNTYFVLEANTLNSMINLGRRVTMGVFDYDMSCKATMFIKRQSGAAPFTGQLEVIQYNTLNYLSIKQFSYTPPPPPFNNNWTAITTSSWSPPGPDLFIRLVFNNPTHSAKSLQVDLLRVSCSW